MLRAHPDRHNLTVLFKLPFGDCFVARHDVSMPRGQWQDKPHVTEIHINPPAADLDNRIGFQKRWLHNFPQSHKRGVGDQLVTFVNAGWLARRSL